MSCRAVCPVSARKNRCPQSFSGKHTYDRTEANPRALGSGQGRDRSDNRDEDLHNPDRKNLRDKILNNSQKISDTRPNADEKIMTKGSHA